MINKRTFVALIEEKSPMCYHVARSLLRSEEDCKDAMQEAVLKAWAARHKLRDEALFATWLTRILMHECRNIQRRGKKYTLVAEAEGPEFSHHEAGTDVWAALDTLPEKLRLPLVLHHIEGYSLKEVSQMLHLPKSTVRGRLYQARQSMRLEMTEESEVRNLDA